MVVGVQLFLAQQLVAAPRDHLVDVHVALGAAAGLPHGQREVAVQRAREDFVAHLRDAGGAFLIQHAQVAIGLRGGLFENCKRANDLPRHLFGADGEILQAALGLRPPIAVGGHPHLAHRIPFDAVFHLVHSLSCLFKRARRFSTVGPVFGAKLFKPSRSGTTARAALRPPSSRAAARGRTAGRAHTADPPGSPRSAGPRRPSCG